MVFKFVLIAELLHWKKTNIQSREKTALAEIPNHISHLTQVALDQIISKVVHI